jgi:hypothetical protein
MEQVSEVVSQLFDPVIFVLIAVSGYLVFLVFFYGTDHWRKLQWGDRMFIGVILGFAIFICLSWCSIIVNVWFLFMRSSPLPNNFTYTIVGTAFVLLVALLFKLRSDAGLPLHDPYFLEKWNSFFNRFKIIYLIEFFIFLIFLVVLVAWQYPLSDFLLDRWMIFCSMAIIGSIPLFCFLPIMLSFLTSLPKTRQDWLDIFLNDLHNFNRKSFFKTVLHLALLFTIAFSITSFDTQLGIFTPKITWAEQINVENGVFTLARDATEEPVIAVSSNTISYHITPALIPDVSITYLAIRNPSNLTVKGSPFETSLSCSDGVNCSLSTDEEMINIRLLTTKRDDYFVTLKYWDSFNIEKIVKIEEIADLPIIDLENGSLQKEYTIKLTNLSPYVVSLDSFTLLDFSSSYNVTHFEPHVSWEPQIGYYRIDEYNSKFTLNGEIDVNSSLNIEMKLICERL